MSRAEVNQVIMKTTMSLIIKGVCTGSPQGFQINVGESKDNIALYCDVSFKERRIFLNSKKDGRFQQQKEIRDFPFQAEKDFEVTITLNADAFAIILPDSHEEHFSSPLSGILCNRIWVEGDATIQGISLM